MFKKIKMLNTAVNGKMFTLNLYFILITMVLPFVQMYFLPLDALKWNEPKFVNKNVALILRSMLTSCGLEIRDIGATYMADHVVYLFKLLHSYTITL